MEHQRALIPSRESVPFAWAAAHQLRRRDAVLDTRDSYKEHYAFIRFRRISPRFLTILALCPAIPMGAHLGVRAGRRASGADVWAGQRPR